MDQNYPFRIKPLETVTDKDHAGKRTLFSGSGWEIMRGANQIIKFILFFLLLACSISACGQRKNAPLAPLSPASGGSASGTLTVTATVVTSVGVIIDQDGQQRIVIANAPDSADNVSHFAMLTDQNGSPANTDPKKSKEKRH